MPEQPGTVSLPDLWKHLRLPLQSKSVSQSPSHSFNPVPFFAMYLKVLPVKVSLVVAVVEEELLVTRSSPVGFVSTLEQQSRSKPV